MCDPYPRIHVAVLEPALKYIDWASQRQEKKVHIDPSPSYVYEFQGELGPADVPVRF